MIYTIVIADDYELFREALCDILLNQYPNARIYEAQRINELYKILDSKGDIDLLLIDLTMPNAAGFYTLIYLRSQYPLLPVVMLSCNESHLLMQRAIEHGAIGFIPKSITKEALDFAIQRILKGRSWLPTANRKPSAVSLQERNAAQAIRKLNRMQLQILQFASYGLRNKEIAKKLSLTENSIRQQMNAALRKLDAKNRGEAIFIAQQLKINRQ